MVNETSEIEQLTYQLSLLDYRIHTGAGGGFMESANRGAFKANELTSVGVLFDKLNAFLEAAQKAQQAQQEQTKGE